MVKYHPNPQIQTEKKEFSNMSAVHIYAEKGKKSNMLSLTKVLACNMFQAGRRHHKDAYAEVPLEMRTK